MLINKLFLPFELIQSTYITIKENHIKQLMNSHK